MASSLFDPFDIWPYTYFPMRIVEGHLPGDKSWRALVILSPGDDIGITWQLGLSLAIANGGELVTAVIVPSADTPSLSEAREPLVQAQELCVESDVVFTVLIEAAKYDKAVRDLIKEAEIDLLLARADASTWQ